MNSLKNFVNKITDNKGTSREAGNEASSAPSFVDQEEQHSAEGFLCPLCMTAFSSPEILEEHYQKTHDDSGRPSAPSHSNGDIGDLKQEILELRESLAAERTSSEQLREEVLQMQADRYTKDEKDKASLKAQEKEFDGAKNLLMSEVQLLRQQLAAELEQVSQLRREKELLGDKLQSFKSESDIKAQRIASLEAQVVTSGESGDSVQLRNEMERLTLLKENEVGELMNKIKALEEELKNRSDSADASREKLVADYENKIKEALTQVDKLHAELQTGQDVALTKQKQLVDELTAVKSELSGVENSRVVAENECGELRAEIQRLQEQHSELYSKIEGGEGTQAALDSIRKENETLTQNLSSSQTQNKELSKNLYNLKLEVDKIREEYASLLEEHQLGNQELISLKDSHKKELDEKENLLRLSGEKNELSQKALVTKDGEMKILRAELDKVERELQSRNGAINECNDLIADLRKNLLNAETKLKAADEAAKRSSQDSKNLQSELAKLQEMCQGKAKEVDDLKNSLKTSEQSVCSLQEELSNARSSLEECQIDSKSQTAILESKLEASTTAYTGILKKYEDSEKAQEDMKASLETQLRQKEELLSEKLTQLEELKQTLGEMKVDLSKSDAKIQQLQVQTDEILTEKIELEGKIKTSEDGKSRLLERCLAGETETERLQETINELRRKLDDSISALQELGRENQSWQMENAKAQGRKWADDSIVTNCLSCNKEFTLTIRKHHCRHCGQIFCSECSSRSASMPSCKKPARVCDSCYDELTMK